MSRTPKLVNLPARLFRLASLLRSARVSSLVTPTVLLMITIFSLSNASAEDIPRKSNSQSTDIFSQVMSELEQIKEVAFTKPFFETAKSEGDDASQNCGCQHCERTEKVCTHLAHPEATKGELDSCETSDPLACSHIVRNTDIIPPVPNIEDYATPDEFVDEDMINKLQSDEVTMETGIENYCDQMARLLCDTLCNSDLDPTKKTAAIKSAMQLVVVNAQIAAEAKIAQMKAAHQSELAIMRGRLLQYGYIESNQKKLFQWLSPIYSNVDRNFQQIEKMAEGSAQLKRCLDIIQTQLNEQQTAKGKNQLIVTNRNQTESLPTRSSTTVKKVSNQFVRTPTNETEDDRVTPVDFQILELRLQKAERLIAELSIRAAEPSSIHTDSHYQASASQQTQPATDAPTHRRASYDRLTPIAPLQPRR